MTLASSTALASATQPGGMTPAQTKAMRNAKEFEAQFLKTMLEQSYAGLSGEGPLGGAGIGSETWRSFLIDEQARAMTATGGIGLAARIYRDTIQRNEGAHA